MSRVRVLFAAGLLALWGGAGCGGALPPDGYELPADDGAADGDAELDAPVDGRVETAPPQTPTPPPTAGDAGRPDGRLDGGARDVAAGDGGASAPVPPQCMRDSDCMLVNDCCWCAALPKRDRPPACDPGIRCLTSTCAQYGGVGEPRCVAGRCILGFDCDTTSVTCKRAPPVCLPGQVPRAIGQGNGRCFGECVDARECLSVPSCGGCARGELCVRYGPSPQSLHCVPAPASCGATPTCGCAAPSVCLPPFSTCQTAAGMPQLSCECTNC